MLHHKSIGIYTSAITPSPEGEGWDEGKCKHLILFSSPQPSPAGEGVWGFYKPFLKL